MRETIVSVQWQTGFPLWTMRAHLTVVQLYIWQLTNISSSSECIVNSNLQTLNVQSTNLFRRMIWKTAWERDEWMLADVTPDVRTLFPCWISLNTSSTVRISSSLSPTIWTCCFASSRTLSFCLLFRRSNTCYAFSDKTQIELYNKGRNTSCIGASYLLCRLCSAHKLIHVLVLTYCILQWKHHRTIS
jgi:hypothetical protein